MSFRHHVARRLTYYPSKGRIHSAVTCRRASSSVVIFFLKEDALEEFLTSVGSLLKIFGPETENAIAPVCVLLNSVSMSLPFRVDRL